jgi:hypothetical protein
MQKEPISRCWPRLARARSVPREMIFKMVLLVGAIFAVGSGSVRADADDAMRMWAIGANMRAMNWISNYRVVEGTPSRSGGIVLNTCARSKQPSAISVFMRGKCSKSGYLARAGDWLWCRAYGSLGALRDR